jgi:glutamine synthetase
MKDGLVEFLELDYSELEKLNIETRELAEQGISAKELEKKYLAILKKETRIKAVTICFTNIEGKLHMLDYDKKYFLSSYDNLTFDGSSIRGFTELAESDLRFKPDFTSFRYLPSDVFGSGKILMFANIADKDGTPYISDFRGRLQVYLEELKKAKGYKVNAANEVEGFLLKGRNAEQNFDAKAGFELISKGGYFSSLPQEELKLFIDKSAEVQRALGFKNEKDHPEVAPAQFELNYSYSDVMNAADQILIYKLVCRQVANMMGMTATFLPKPIAGINGSGMHTNISIEKDGRNIFFDANGKDGMSKVAWDFIDRTLGTATDMCLVLNSSVNAYRRLDPNFEAPNQIKVSAVDRGSMVRIPIGNEKSARIEIRSIGPDANPYLLYFVLVKAGLEGKPFELGEDKRPRVRFLAGNIQTAIAQFKQSEFMTEIMGEDSKRKFAEYKQEAANRSPLELGTKVKDGEVLYHHEVTNQFLWSDF